MWLLYVALKLKPVKYIQYAALTSVKGRVQTVL